MKRQYLTINQAAQRLGVSTKTLRRWEEKGILVPKRSIGNQRRYLLSDIEKREKKAFTINEAAARLFVSANTLRRWEAKGIITPKRSIGNQRFYTLADIQKLEAMHYPTVDKEETTTIEQAPDAMTQTTSPVIARSEETSDEAILSRHAEFISASPTQTNEILKHHEGALQGTVWNPALQVQNDTNNDTAAQFKPRFFDLASIEKNNDVILGLDPGIQRPLDSRFQPEADRSFGRHGNDKIATNNTPRPVVIKPITPIVGGSHPPTRHAEFSPAFHGIPKPIDADREQTHHDRNNDEIASSSFDKLRTSRNDGYKRKPSIPWHIARPSAHWAVALSSFIGVILVLAAITTYGDPVKLLSYIPYLNISQNIISSSDEDVLQSATARRDLALKINLPVEMMQSASVAGNLTAPNILYSVLPGENITISGDPQNPVISATVGDLEDFGFIAGDGIAFDGTTITNDDPGSTQNIFKNIKVGSDTISAGSNTDTLELAAGSNVTLTTDTSNKKITISASGGSSGGGISGIAVLEGGTTISDDIDTLDFLGGDFDVGESPSGQANIQLASTLTSVTGVAGNFSIGGITTLNGITYTWPGSEGADYILQTDGAGSLTWIDSSSLPDIGDVVGPGSATDHALVRFDGTTGKLIQNSGIIIDDSNNVTGVNALTVAPASNTTALTITGTNTTSQNLAYFNAHNASGTIVDISYGSTQTLTGSLIGQAIDLNNGQVTATNQDVTGQRITLPTVTNTNAAGTVNLRGLQVNFGSGAGINQNGAGATVFSNLDVQLPALTQTQGTLTANGLAVTTPSSITTGGTANGLLISPTGVGSGTLNGVNIATISAAGNGNETAINVGTNWDTVLRVNGTPVINGQGVTLATGGGTGQSTYAVGDILYADGTGTLAKLPIGNTDDYVLKVSSGVPVWGTVAGDSCSTCVITDPSSSATNTITPTGQSTTGLIVRQTSTASPTDDIFQVTDSTGANVYFRIDQDGNVYPSSAIGDTLTLTPNNDTTALTLVGTNVITQPLAYLNANNQSGNIFNVNYGASQTLSTTTPVNGIAVDLSTNVTATNTNITGTSLTLPGTTNTHTSGLKELTGVSVTAGGGINQNGAGGTTTFAAFDATIPALTETAGTLNGYGLNVTTPSSITTGGTAAALNVSASGVGAGTLYGLNVSGITAGAGTQTALNIGTGWDSILSLNGTPIIDGSGNINIGNATGVLPIENGGSPFEQAAGAIFPRIITQDLLIGGVSTDSARFHVWGTANAGTTPVASVSGNTSETAFIVDNRGSGNLFSAASSGLERFVITQAGNVGIGTNNPSQMLDITGGALEVTGNTSTAIADTFTGTTQQSYIHFPQISGSNDPGFIMHETQGSGDTNEGVIHLSPSDDNGFGDYVSIHGTNDPDTLKLHTDGTIEGVNDFYVSGQVGIGTTTLDEALNISGNVDLNGGELYLNNTAGAVYGFGYGVEGGSEATLFVDQFLDFTESDGDAIVMRLDANNTRLGIGESSPDTLLHLTGTSSTAIMRLQSTSSGLSAVSQTMTGIELLANGMNTTSQYTPAIKFGSTDSNFTTTNPKFLAGIVGEATETYGADTDSGMALNFLTTPNDAGTAPTPSIRMTIDEDGLVGIGTTNPTFPLYVATNVTSGTGACYGYLRATVSVAGQNCGGISTAYSAFFATSVMVGAEVHALSDQRAKDFLEDLSPEVSLDAIGKLRPLHYTWKEELKKGGQVVAGFFAQEIEEIIPEAVTISSGANFADERSLNYNILTSYTISALQGLNKKVDASNAALFRNLSLTSSGDLNIQSQDIQTQTLTLGGVNVNNKLIGLETGIATVSAGLNTSLNSQITSLNSQFSSLTSRIASLEAQLQQFTVHGSQFTASSSAELSLESLEVNGQILADSLSILGYTTMNELSVTGSIRTGVLTIKGQSNGGASISTLNGDLRLQEQGFGGIDVLDGLVTIDTAGNIETKGTITAKKINIDETNTLSASVGQGTIPLNGLNALIYTTAVTNDSHIFVTPRTKTNQQLSVTTQVSGGYFKVEITSPAPVPIKFDWFIVN